MFVQLPDDSLLCIAITRIIIIQIKEIIISKKKKKPFLFGMFENEAMNQTSIYFGFETNYLVDRSHLHFTGRDTYLFFFVNTVL